MNIFSPTSLNSDGTVYSFDSEDNSQKWKGIFVEALEKVQRQVGHQNLTAKKDALLYIESLILRLLGMLCTSQPHVIQDVGERVTDKFPDPIDKWAINEAQRAIEKGNKKKSGGQVLLPVEKVHPLLVKEVLGYKVDFQVSLYIVAVLEYIAADILKLTGNYVKNMKHEEITCQDIKVAMCADKVLMDMFFQDSEDVSMSVEDEPTIYRALSYEDLVKDLILEENQYMRDLNMIIKVFRDPFVQLFPRSKDLDVIFSNILEIHEMTANFISNLEDTLELTEEKRTPFVSSIFEDMAEAAEFDAYERYTEGMLMPHCRERLNTLLQRSDTCNSLRSAGQGFKDAVKYVLPRLLMGPIYHCLLYFDAIKALMEVTTDSLEEENLSQAFGSLHQTKTSIERKINGVSPKLPKRRPGDISLRFQGHHGRQQKIARMNELQKAIDGWEGKPIVQNCNEFIMEGLLYKVGRGRLAERHVFLFDGLIVLCKGNAKRMSVTGPASEFRFKEKFLVRKVDFQDREDNEVVEHAFDIKTRDETVVLAAKSVEDKNNWMAALIALQTRSMLERMLDTKLSEEEKLQPLRLPSPDQYRFAVEDSDETIVFEDNQEYMESPLIKGGTLIKLVERLTYHMYADLKFVKTFLTTYRSFCSQPTELLDLLIERFNIPEPPPEEGDTLDKGNQYPAREDLKRLKKEYVKPVQFRVLNVLRHWVDQHYYDFERDEDLLETLNDFLDNTVKGKAMRKWVESIRKIVQRRIEGQNGEKELVFSVKPPAIEWFTAKSSDEYNLMTLHPIEIARQVTLLEFDLYKAVKPSELVGSVWTKKEKRNTSPNLLKMIDHSTRFTFWLEKCIVEAENFEERVAVISRCLEILWVFQELKNFNGVLEIVSALNSAPVYRLEHTFTEIQHKLQKVLDEANELNADHYKKYIEKLRSINPPCVPFLGMYLTNILLTEEGNPDFLLNRPPGLINFSKRRKVAEITSEIEQYQNTPYALEPEYNIREYFEKLDPLAQFDSEKDFNEYLYNQSLKVEPRNCKQPPKFLRKTEYTLKSPGIKTGGRNTLKHQLANITTPSLQDINKHFHFPGGRNLDDEDVSSSLPTTPNTPQSPPHTANSDTSVFATVLIGTSNEPSISSSSVFTDSTPKQSIADDDAEEEEKPPELPPRRGKPSNKLDSPVSKHFPIEPPRRLNRHDFSPPPPLPPKNPGTLPRANTFSYNTRAVKTLPRRLSERTQQTILLSERTAGRLSGATSSLTLNGDSEPTPELPPRDYKKPRKTSS